MPPAPGERLGRFPAGPSGSAIAFTGHVLGPRMSLRRSVSTRRRSVGDRRRSGILVEDFNCPGLDQFLEGGPLEGLVVDLTPAGRPEVQGLATGQRDLDGAA